jgi:hypothetical protein
MVKKLFGPRSKKMVMKHYQRASNLLNLNRKDEAIEAIKLAIDISNNPEKDLSEIKGDAD